jgi:SAM-dependent methyltransferase
MPLIEKLRNQLHQDGVWGTAVRAGEHLVYLRNRWIDRRFDARWGTDTSGVVAKAALRLEGEHASFASDYEPIQVPVFRSIMRDLRIDHADYAFIDFGSGKGRALLMAAQYPFRRIIGVELSPVLHEAAMRNVAAFERRKAAGARIELLCEDALRYRIPDEDAVCFFYNPFGRPLVEKLIANLEASLARAPRRLVVVYRNPVCADLFDRAPFLGLAAARRTYRVYETE